MQEEIEISNNSEIQQQHNQNENLINNQFGQSDQLQFSLFSHDQYMLVIPNYTSQSLQNHSYQYVQQFLNDFPFYNKIKDRKGRIINSAPVVRLYGNDAKGDNVCLHVHGYFPYFYFRVSNLKHLYENDETFFDKLIDLIEEGYYSVYSVSEKQKKYLQNTTPIIFNYELVHKKDIYGYHANEEPFLKITYFNPKHLRKLVNILESGIIMNQQFVIYEGHLTYFLRFYSDLDIGGLRQVRVSKYSLRNKWKIGVQGLVQGREESRYNSNEQNIFNSMTRLSGSDVEADVYYEDILNYIFLQEEKLDEDSNIFSICRNNSSVNQKLTRQRESSVQINRSLNIFWEEEISMQRELFGIKDCKNTFTIDYTHNIETLFINDDDVCLENQEGKDNMINEEDKQKIIQQQKQKEELRKRVNNDIYWINQLKLSKSMYKQCYSHIQDYIQNKSIPIDLPQSLFLNHEIKLNFHQIIKQQKDEGITSIENRNKRYGQRKVDYYDKLQHGQTEELDQIQEEEQDDGDELSDNDDGDDYENQSDSHNSDEDNVDEDQDEEQQQPEGIEDRLDRISILGKKRSVDEYLNRKSDGMKQQPQQQQQQQQQQGEQMKKHIKLEYEKQPTQKNNNVQIWRNNFKAVKNNLNLEDSLFTQCQYCKSFKSCCKCNQETNSTTTTTQQQLYSDDYLQQFYNNQSNQSKQIIYNHSSKCPSFQDILSTGITSLLDTQYAYYSKIEDLFDHYDIKNKNIPQSLQYAQILDKDILKIPEHKQYYVGLQNQFKLPQYYRCYITLDYINNQNNNNNNFKQSNQSFIYQKTCPTFNSISIDFNKNKINNNVVKKKNDDDKLLSVQKNWLSPFSNKTIMNNNPQNQSNNPTNSNSNLMKYHEDLTIYYFEVFAKSIPDMLPNPKSDPISFLIYVIDNKKRPEIQNQGIILVDEQNYTEHPSKIKKYYGLDEQEYKEVKIVKNEEELLLQFIKQIHYYNIDIITGWDIEKKSLFYLSHRCWYLNIDIMDILARCPTNHDNILKAFNIAYHNNNSISLSSNHQYEYSNQSSSAFNSNQSFKLENIAMQHIRNSHRAAKQTGFFANFKLNFTVSGRMILNVWRIVKHDYKLYCYELESVVESLLNERMPIFTNWTLTQMYNHEDIQKRSYVFSYFMKRLQKTIQIAEHCQIINTCSEEAKLYGFDFQSAINKGHQFRIEHIMNRVTEQLGYKLMSASRYGVQTQKMLECSPLTLEPPKLFYTDPVIVLDFQSLYPSLMIGYNLCYSTCLGNIDELFSNGGMKRVGVQNKHDIDIESLLKSRNNNIDELMKDIFVTPNKVVYVKKNIREGVYPQILNEFFMTRLFIKQSMNKYKNNPIYQQIYNKLQQRQKSLKLFMCVVFGYTGATYSGRMPLGELADSIIQTGKFVLNQVITLVNTTKSWNAQVIYGDTDSIFVNIKGASVKDAIAIGKTIEQQVSTLFPYPMKLKYEKTFKELVMVTKKRYVGYQVENENDIPKLEAKGLELIRKDGCKALQNMMKNSLEILMKTKNITKIKEYLNGQWQDLLNDRINYRDLIISKECKLENYTMHPPHAKVELKSMARDPQTKHKYGQRINYVIINNLDSSKLIDSVVSVQEFLQSYQHQQNIKEYIEKQINPPLARLFSTFDVDINEWFNNMDRKQVRDQNIIQIQNNQPNKNKEGNNPNNNNNINNNKLNNKQTQLKNYYNKEECIVCKINKTKNNICFDCLQHPQTLLQLLITTRNNNIIQNNIANLNCSNCASIQFNHDDSGDSDLLPCIQYQCPNLFNKSLTNNNVQNINPILDHYIQIIASLIHDY